MRLNGLCPICYIKRIFTPKSKLKTNLEFKQVEPKNALTPVMGWSSWNTFKNNISEDVIYDTAKALRDTGLLDAGYDHINIDDNWMSSSRDQDGNLQGDLLTFPSGIPELVSKINKLGIKVGIYVSNGTKTCENLPSSLYHEERDAKTFARWGIEYLKYDYCHNKPISKYAPLIYGVSISKDTQVNYYEVQDAQLTGLATLRKSKKAPNNLIVTGLDKNAGSMEFLNVDVEADGEYVLTLHVVKKGRYNKYIHILVNDDKEYNIYVPSQKHWNQTAKFQTNIMLNKGQNSIKLFNPIATRADSTLMQYRHMNNCLDNATNMNNHLNNDVKALASDNSTAIKPITFSICEWGFNKPWKWGQYAGNSWRTTLDIFPKWWRILQIYKRNVKLYKYASPGHWNDPDMLEVGNGNLTLDESKAHFSVWAMMNAPLILGNDLRIAKRNILRIVTNIRMIKINQDPLGKQAKRIKKGSLDILVKPLIDDKVAICFFNKKGSAKNAKINFKNLQKDPYINLKVADVYSVWDVWEHNSSDKNLGFLDTTIDKHSANVYIITPKDPINAASCSLGNRFAD